MSKVDISMTDAEVDAFLTRCPHMVVGALDAAGWPTGTIATSTYVDGTLTVRFAAAAPLLGDVCCVADEHASYFEIRGVIVHDRAAPDAVDPAVAVVEPERVVSFDFGRLRST
mgnify:CR=1 FL=1